MEETVTYSKTEGFCGVADIVRRTSNGGYSSSMYKMNTTATFEELCAEHERMIQRVKEFSDSGFDKEVGERLGFKRIFNEY